MRISVWSSDVCSSDLLVAESNFRAFDIFAGSFGGNPMAPEIFRRSSCRAGPCKRVEDDFIWPAQEFDHLGCQRDRHASRMGRKAGVSACFGVSLVSRVRRSDEHTSELQSLMRISYAVFCLKKQHNTTENEHQTH